MPIFVLLVRLKGDVHQATCYKIVPLQTISLRGPALDYIDGSSLPLWCLHQYAKELAFGSSGVVIMPICFLSEVTLDRPA